MTVAFELEGQRCTALDGGPILTFDEDELREKLAEGGAPGRCGWLRDRYGVSR